MFEDEQFDNSTESFIDRGLYIHGEESMLYVEEYGPSHAPVLYYLHSGPGYNAHSFKTLMHDGLTMFRVIYADQRGGGRSVGEGGHQPEVLAHDIGVVLDELGIEKAALLSHGFGTLPAILFAETNPERVTQLLMMNPWVSLPHLASDMYRAARLITDGVEPTSVPPGDAALVDEAFRTVNPKQLLDSMQFPKMQTRLHLEHVDAEGVIVNDQTEDIDMYWSLDYSAKLKDFTVPIVVIAGQYDKTSYPGQVQLVLEAQPDAMVAFLPGGHYLYVDDPIDLEEIIQQAVGVGN